MKPLKAATKVRLHDLYALATHLRNEAIKMQKIADYLWLKKSRLSFQDTIDLEKLLTFGENHGNAAIRELVTALRTEI